MTAKIHSSYSLQDENLKLTLTSYTGADPGIFEHILSVKNSFLKLVLIVLSNKEINLARIDMS